MSQDNVPPASRTRTGSPSREPTNPDQTPNPPAKPVPGDAASSASRTLVRVLLVQAATMILLWLLQSRYHG